MEAFQSESPIPAEPDPDSVTPGPMGLVMMALLFLAVILLVRSMSKHLRRISAPRRAELDDLPGDDQPSEARRLAATPKWVLLTVLVLGLAIAFGLASDWQYRRALGQVDAQRAAASTPEPIGELVPDASTVPVSSLGRLAVVQGSYVADAWVVNRASPEGAPGVWLVSAVDDGSGLLTAVLRGWQSAAATTPTPADDEVTVIGRVSSPENFYLSAQTDRPDSIVAITDEQLARIWGLPVRAGYVVLQQQQPALAEADPIPVRSVFGMDDAAGFPWQNAGYAVQWIVFIFFVGFMYARMFRDDLSRGRERSSGVVHA